MKFAEQWNAKTCNDASENLYIEVHASTLPEISLAIYRYFEWYTIFYYRVLDKPKQNRFDAIFKSIYISEEEYIQMIVDME